MLIVYSTSSPVLIIVFVLFLGLYYPFSSLLLLNFASYSAAYSSIFGELILNTPSDLILIMVNFLFLFS